VAALPEHLRVLEDLFLGFPFDFFGDVLDVVAAVLLVQTDELATEFSIFFFVTDTRQIS
jgi:hypothetical protein